MLFIYVRHNFSLWLEDQHQYAGYFHWCLSKGRPSAMNFQILGIDNAQGYHIKINSDLALKGGWCPPGKQDDQKAPLCQPAIPYLMSG